MRTAICLVGFTDWLVLTDSFIEWLIGPAGLANMMPAALMNDSWTGAKYELDIELSWLEVLAGPLFNPRPGCHHTCLSPSSSTRPAPPRRFLQGLFTLALDASPAVRKAVCTGLVSMLMAVPERLDASMADLIEYMLKSTQVV